MQIVEKIQIGDNFVSLEAKIVNVFACYSLYVFVSKLLRANLCTFSCLQNLLRLQFVEVEMFVALLVSFMYISFSVYLGLCWYSHY